MTKKRYTVKRDVYFVQLGGYVTETMGKDGAFYLALAASELPKCITLAEAKTFYNLHAYKHHNLYKTAYIEGPRKGLHKLNTLGKR